MFTSLGSEFGVAALRFLCSVFDLFARFSSDAPVEGSRCALWMFLWKFIDFS